MKKTNIFLFLSILCLSYSVYSQSADEYFLFNLNRGAILKYVTYKGDKEPISRIIEIKIKNKDKITLSTAYYQSCTTAGTSTPISDVLFKDNEILYPIDLTEYGISMRLDKNSDRYINFPVDMQINQKLPDVLSHGVGDTKEGDLFTFKYEYINRTVAGVELVTTPAGSFECTKITYVYKATLKETKDAAIWISKKVGIVKTEYYSKKGEIVEKDVLDEINY